MSLLLEWLGHQSMLAPMSIVIATLTQGIFSQIWALVRILEKLLEKRTQCTPGLIHRYQITLL